MKDKEITKVQELAYELLVSNAMTKDVITVNPDDKVGKLREIFKENKISGAPVVKDNKLIGIISIEDFIKCLLFAQIDSYIKDKMTKSVITLYADDPLIHAVNKFEKYGVGRIPVIERESKKLVGIISKGDIIKCFLNALEISYHEEELRKFRSSHIFEDIKADKVSLTVEGEVKGGDFKNAGRVSSSLKKSLQRLGFSPQIVRKAVISSYEAEMNIIIFAIEGQIKCIITPENIRIIAEDRGPGIKDIEKAMQPGFSTASDEIRELGFGAGMGLPNIKKCSDEFKITSEINKGTLVQSIIYLKR